MLKKSWKKILVSAAVMMLGVVAFQGYSGISNLPSYIDPVMETTIEKEETPLAAQPQVTTKTKTKTTKANVKLKKASTRSYTKMRPTQTKKTTKTKNTSEKTVKVETTVRTAVTEKYTKNSYRKLVTKKVTTTVRTTTTWKETVNNQPQTDSSKIQTFQAETSVKNMNPYEIGVNVIAPKMDARVRSAYDDLGFKIQIDPGVSYSGYFEAKSRQITLKEENDTVYHELGHFLAFIAGNADTSSSFVSVYNSEKAKVTGSNKAYVTQSSSEYFAESVKDYVLSPATLKSQRPNTYAEIEKALSKVTSAQIARLKLVYSVIW